MGTCIPWGGPGPKPGVICDLQTNGPAPAVAPYATLEHTRAVKTHCGPERMDGLNLTVYAIRGAGRMELLMDGYSERPPAMRTAYFRGSGPVQQSCALDFELPWCAVGPGYALAEIFCSAAESHANVRCGPADGLA